MTGVLCTVYGAQVYFSSVIQKITLAAALVGFQN